MASSQQLQGSAAPELPPRYYETGDEIARGGMGAVRSVFDGNIRRDVAMKVLLEGGGDANQANDKRTTPLMNAAHHGHEASVSALLAAKADPNARNAMGATALHLAAFGARARCITLLLEAGGKPKLTIQRGALAGASVREMAQDPETIQVRTPLLPTFPLCLHRPSPKLSNQGKTQLCVPDQLCSPR